MKSDGHTRNEGQVKKAAFVPQKQTANAGGNKGTLFYKLNQGAFDQTLAKLYGEEHLSSQKSRYKRSLESFVRVFGTSDRLHLFSSPGRTEIGGNHTDHNCGLVLAGAISLDLLAVARPSQTNQVRIKSKGYPMLIIDLGDLAPRKKKHGSSLALVRGIAYKLQKLGYEIGGFDLYLSSTIPKGSGLSSSAAFELMIGTVLNHLYNQGKISSVELAQVGAFAENVYFGKPSGLMDQMACACGGIVSIDFKDENNPAVRKINRSFADLGLTLCIVNTGSSHASLTDHYASIPDEMGRVAAMFGKRVLREVTCEDLIRRLPEIRQSCGDRAALRSLHFMRENERVTAQANAFLRKDRKALLALVLESGTSSSQFLQNIYSIKAPSEQGLTLALFLAELHLRGKGAWRVHGGGFAGTTFNLVPDSYVPEFSAAMNAAFGPNSCLKLSIRPVGATAVKESI